MLLGTLCTRRTSSLLRTRFDARYNKPNNKVPIFGMIVYNFSPMASLRAHCNATTPIELRADCYKTLMLRGTGESFMRIPVLIPKAVCQPMATTSLHDSLRGRSCRVRPPECASSLRALLSIRPSGTFATGPGQFKKLFPNLLVEDLVAPSLPGISPASQEGPGAAGKFRNTV